MLSGTTMGVCVKSCPCSTCVSSRIDVSDLGPDERRVLQRIADRLRLGAKQYGALNIAKDKREWKEEAAQEALDLAVYLSIGLVK